jgi:prepilin-type N-terminal cleavage/methylation domain-containing protein
MQVHGAVMDQPVIDKNSTCSSRHYEKGMTIIELIVSLTVGAILLTSAWSFFGTQTTNFEENRQTAEMQEELRWAMQYVSEHIRLAGNAVPPTSGWQVIENKNGSGSGPDSLIVLGSYRSLVVNTSQPMGNEGAQIKVTSTEGIGTGDLIVISDGTFSELFYVTDVQSDHLYHMQYLPYNDDNKLLHRYAEDSTVTVVSHYSFFIGTDENGHLNLMTKTQAYPPQVLGGDIEDFQIRFKMKSGAWQNIVSSNEVYDIRQIEITMRARSPKPFRNYHDPVYGDGYKRLELKCIVIPKNIAVT